MGASDGKPRICPVLICFVFLLVYAPLGARGLLHQPSVTMQLQGKSGFVPNILPISSLRFRRKESTRSAISLLGTIPGLQGYRGPVRAKLQWKQRLFLTQVRLGDGQSFAMLVDTGSGSLAVPAISCDSPACRQHRRFRPEEDSSGNFLGVESSDIRLSYASGFFAGSGFEGHVCFGVGSMEDLKESDGGVKACGKVRFVVASFESADFNAYHFDGILGLGPPRQGAGKGFNVMDALVEQNVLQEASFVLALRSTGDSTLTFGSVETDCLGNNRSVDHLHHDSSLDVNDSSNETSAACENQQQLPVDVRHGEWAVTVDDVFLDDRALHLCGAEGCRAVLDSGCAGIAMPKKFMEKLRSQMNLNDCTYAKSMPTLGFVFNGQRFKVGSDHYVQVSESDPSQCRVLVNELNEDSSTRTIILGVPFLLDRMVRFDQRLMQITLSGRDQVMRAEV